MAGLSRIDPLNPGVSVAQTFQSAVSRVFQPAPSTCAIDWPTGKSAVQHVGKPALPAGGSWEGEKTRLLGGATKLQSKYRSSLGSASHIGVG